MKIKVFTFFAILCLIKLLKAEGLSSEDFLFKSGYNSNEIVLSEATNVDNAVALIACVGCHNSKATYSVLQRDDEGFKLSYYGAVKNQLSDSDKYFSLSKEEGAKLMEILRAQVESARGVSNHKESKKRGSSFEFGLKEGDSWIVAGHYSKGSPAFVKKISNLLKAKEQGDFSNKLKAIF